MTIASILRLADGRGRPGQGPSGQAGARLACVGEELQARGKLDLEETDYS